MSDKYVNKEGVNIDIHTDRRGKDHVDFYDRDPQDSSHESIHINWDSSTGKGNIHDTTGGSDTNTDIRCYLTSACMKHFQNNFNDNCEELTVLRWLSSSSFVTTYLSSTFSGPLILTILTADTL